MRLNNEELLNVEGGGFGSIGFLTGLIVGVATFVIGVIDGIVNPNKCH